MGLILDHMNQIRTGVLGPLFELEQHDLVKNGASQGTNFFTYESCPIGLFHGTKDLYMGHRQV